MLDSNSLRVKEPYGWQNVPYFLKVEAYACLSSDIIFFLYAVCMVEERKLVLDTPDKAKEARKIPRVPLGSRNCYQMFTKIEGDKIRSIYGDSVDIRDMVARTWRLLSDDDKRVQPTVLALPSPHSKIKLVRLLYEQTSGGKLGGLAEMDIL